MAGGLVTRHAVGHAARRRRRPFRHLAAAGALLQAVLACGAAMAQPPGAGRPPVDGRWLTKDQSTVLDIGPCGDEVCGRIVAMTRWPKTGVPTDLHGVPECGMTIMRGFRRSGGNLWDGRILDPDTGEDYTAEMWLGQEGRLHLRGYIGVPLFGLTQVWTRYPYLPPPDCHLPPLRGG